MNTKKMIGNHGLHGWHEYRNSGMKIMSIALVRLIRAQHSFPFQVRILEIDEQNEIQVGDV
jgi:hypothetical protein